MNIEINKILVSDYDQTFYIDDEDIEINKKYIDRFMNENNIFIIATGRSYYDFQNKLEKYNFKYNYVILNHGATIMDEKNNILLNKTIPNEIILDLKEALELEKAVSNFCCSGIESRVDFEYKDLTKINVKYNNKEEAMLKANIINSKYGEYVNAYYTAHNSVEIISKKTNKSFAIYEIMQLNNVNKENVYTIGDGYSDIEMVKEFNGYCMKESVEDLKKVAIKELDSVHILVDMLLKKESK